MIVITARWAAAFTWLATPAGKHVESRRVRGARGSSCPASFSLAAKLSFRQDPPRRRLGLSPARTVSHRRAAPASARPCDRGHPLQPVAPRAGGLPGAHAASANRAQRAGGEPGAELRRLRVGFIAGQPGNLRVCRRGPLRGRAGLAEAGGSHRQHQRLASGLQPRSWPARCALGPGGPGPQRPAGSGATCSLRSHRTAPG